jgi:hypothetical protein
MSSTDRAELRDEPDTARLGLTTLLRTGDEPKLTSVLSPDDLRRRLADVVSKAVDDH